MSEQHLTQNLTAFDLSKGELDVLTYAIAQILPKLLVRDWLIVYLNPLYWLNRELYYQGKVDEALSVAVQVLEVRKAIWAGQEPPAAGEGGGDACSI